MNAPADFKISDEEVFAAACLVSAPLIDRTMWLDTERMSDPMFAAVVDACRSIVLAGGTVTPVEVAHAVPDVEPATIQRLRRFAMVNLASAEADGYEAAKRVHRRARVWQTIDVARSLEAAGKAALEDDEAPIDQVCMDAQRGLDEVLRLSGDSSGTAMSVRKAVQRAVAAATGDGPDRVFATGLVDLDRRLSGGFRPGQMVVLAARPSMGKTTLATSLALSLAERGAGVGFFSVEMGEAVMPRLLADATWRKHPMRTSAAPEFSPPTYAQIKARTLSGDQRKKLAAGAAWLQGLPIEFEFRPRITADHLRATVRRMRHRMVRRGGSLDVVFVDHIGKMAVADRYKGNRHREVADLTGDLADIAKQEGICLVALHQLNRGVETRDSKRPALADLRDSGSVEEDADVVMFLFRPAYYLAKQAAAAEGDKAEKLAAALEANRNLLEIITDKNRDGETGADQFVTFLEYSHVSSRLRGRPGDDGGAPGHSEAWSGIDA